MSDTIDYDEIDKAVRAAQALEKEKQNKIKSEKRNPATKTSAHGVNLNDTTNASEAKATTKKMEAINKRPAPTAEKRRIMDFVSPSNHVNHHPIAGQAKLTKLAPKTNAESTAPNSAESASETRTHLTNNRIKINTAAQLKSQRAATAAIAQRHAQIAEAKRLAEARAAAHEEALKKQELIRKRQAQIAAAQKAAQANPSHADMPHYHSAPIQNTASPQVNAEIRRRQIALKKQQLAHAEELKRRQAQIHAAQLKARAEAKRTASERELDAIFNPEATKEEEIFESFEEINTENPLTDENSAHSELAKSAAAAKASLQHKHEADEPNANNYSLGVRSPFIVNTKVEKRPLGSNYSDSNEEIRSTKNVYSQKDPSHVNDEEDRYDSHTVIETEEHRSSGWIWTAIALFVIIAGGALGYLAYLLVFAE